MRRANQFKLAIIVTGCVFAIASTAAAFEGRINAVTTRGNQTDVLLYTAGSNFLRVENTATNWPSPVDILDRNSGELTLLFPNNRSFVRLKSAVENRSPVPTGVSAMPMMPPPMMENADLKATGDKTNLLGFACEKYEIKQRGETMDIWATDQLFPFQPYVQNQPHHFGPRMIQEQWPELVKDRKLFPLLAILKFDNGMERFRFEVTSVTPDKLAAGDEQLFQPPANYFEIQPLPF
jgi:hypothetical protein